MALKASRVGVAPSEVDPYGRIKNGGSIQIVNDLNATNPGSALDAVQGKVLNEKFNKYGSLESVVRQVAGTATFTAESSCVYLCIILDASTCGCWIVGRKGTSGNLGANEIFNNSNTRFSLTISGDDVTIASAQYGAIISVTRLA